MIQRLELDKALALREKTIKRMKKYTAEGDFLKRQMLILEDDIDDYAGLIQEIKKSKTHSFSTILEADAKIKLRLNFIKTKISVKKMNAKFNKWGKELEKLKKSKEYESEIIESVKNSIKRYAWYLEDLPKWEPEELEDMFFSRDTIEMLKQEINNPQELMEIENKLKEADEKLKKQVPEIRNKIFSRETDKIYPKSFLWRHIKGTQKAPKTILVEP